MVINLMQSYHFLRSSFLTGSYGISDRVTVGSAVYSFIQSTISCREYFRQEGSLLTSWCSISDEYLIATRLIKKNPRFNETRKFITVLKNAIRSYPGPVEFSPYSLTVFL